jgi:hypothetical protein
MKFIHTPLAVAAASLLVACGSSGGGSTTTPPDGNNTFATAQAVTVGSTTSGAIASSTDDDWYKFTTTGAGTITVTLAGLSADADLALYDAGQVSLGASHNTGTAADTVTWVAPGAGTFYAHVIPMATTTPYTLAVAFTPTVVGDGNDTFATAQAISVGTTVNAAISSATDDDWYKFTTTGAGTISVSLTGLSADANLALVDAAQAVLVGSANAGVAADGVTWAAGAAATFWLHIIPVAAATPYTLAVAFTPAVVGDGNDTFATAQAISVGAANAGAIASPTDDDWYKFTIMGPGTITVTLSGLTADANLALYDSSQVLLGSSALAGTAIDTVSYTTTAAGIFYALVVPLATPTPYVLTVTFTPSTAPDGNDTFATAQLIALPSTTMGVISGPADFDWYKFTTPAAGTVTVTLAGLSADADLELYGASGFSLASSNMAGTAVDTVTYTATISVTYYVLVKPVGPVAYYTLTTAFTP